MLFFIGFALLVVIGVVLLVIAENTNNYDMSEAFELMGAICMVVGGAFFLLISVILPFARTDMHSEIAEFNSVQQTIEVARINDKYIGENVALQMKVIDANKWLSKTLYYNKCLNGWLYGWFIPDEIMDLEPIE